MKRQILYEDNHLLVVSKRAGALVQGDRSGQPSLQQELKCYLKERDQKPGKVYLGIVHRLDKPVSGVTIFAKTSKAAGRLCRLFREKQIDKLYCALSYPGPGSDQQTPSWQKEHTFLRRIKDKTVVCRPEAAGAQEAMLCQKIVRWDSHWLHIIRLITGRKHQIRAQLAAGGQPIIGDLKYGETTVTPDGGIRLHAFCCGFRHPVGNQPLAIYSAPPRVFLEALRNQEQRLLLEHVAAHCNELRGAR